MNALRTIKNLREQFPEFDLDTIVKILECMDDSDILYTRYPLVLPNDNTPSIFPNTITCQNAGPKL